MKAGPRVLVALVLVGCGVSRLSSSGISYPAGPTLAELGYAERCRQNTSCTDAATEVFEQSLTRLGKPMADAEIGDPALPPVEGRLQITFDSDPPFEWRTSTGDSGTSPRISVDLSNVGDGGTAYVVVEQGKAFVIDEAAARAMVDALFIPAP